MTEEQKQRRIDLEDEYCWKLSQIPNEEDRIMFVACELARHEFMISELIQVLKEIQDAL